MNIRYPLRGSLSNTYFEDSVRNRIRNHEMAAYKDSLAHRLFREAQEIRKQVDNPNSK